MAAQRAPYKTWAASCVKITQRKSTWHFFGPSHTETWKVTDDTSSPPSRSESKTRGGWPWFGGLDPEPSDASLAQAPAAGVCTNATREAACSSCICCRGCPCSMSNSTLFTLVVGAVAAAILLFLVTAAAARLARSRRSGHEEHGDDGTENEGDVDDVSTAPVIVTPAERNVIVAALARWREAGMLTGEKHDELVSACQAPPPAGWGTAAADHAVVLRRLGTASLIFAIVVALMEHEAASVIRLVMAPALMLVDSPALGKALGLLMLASCLHAASAGVVHSTARRKWGHWTSIVHLIGEFCFLCAIGAWVLSFVDTGTHKGETAMRDSTGRRQRAGGSRLWYECVSLLCYVISGPLHQALAYAQRPTAREFVLAPLALALFAFVKSDPFVSVASGVALSLHGQAVEWRDQQSGGGGGQPSSRSASYCLSLSLAGSVFLCAVVAPVLYLVDSDKVGPGTSLALGLSILVVGEATARRPNVADSVRRRPLAICWYVGTALLVWSSWDWLANVALKQVVVGYGATGATLATAQGATRRTLRREARHDSILRLAISAVAVAPALIAYACFCSKRLGQAGPTVMRVAPERAKAHGVATALAMIAFAFVRLTSSWVQVVKEENDGGAQACVLIWICVTPVLRLALYAAAITLAAYQGCVPYASGDVKNAVINLHFSILCVCLEVLSMKGTADLGAGAALDALYDLDDKTTYGGRAALLPWGLPLFALAAVLTRNGHAGSQGKAQGQGQGQEQGPGAEKERPWVLSRKVGIFLLGIHSVLFASLHLLGGPSWSSFFVVIALVLFALPWVVRALSA